MARQTRTFNINDMSTWGIPVTLMIAGLIIFTLVYVLKTFLVDNINRTIGQKNNEITRVEKAYTDNKKILAILPQIKQEVSRLRHIRDEAIKFLPTDVSMPSLIDSVYDSARKNDIVFNSFTPQPDIETPYYTIKPISLSTDIGYLSMAAFIEEVTTLKRIMNIDSVSFSRSENTPRAAKNAPLTMTAQLRTYIFKE